MKLTDKTQKLIGTKANYGEELLGVWEHPDISEQDIVNGLEDLIEDTESALQDVMDDIQAVVNIMLRNPVYNQYTKEEFLPLIEKIASAKSQLHASITDVTFAAQIALNRHNE